MSTHLQTTIRLIAACKKIAALLKRHLYIHLMLGHCGDSWSFFLGDYIRSYCKKYKNTLEKFSGKTFEH